MRKLCLFSAILFALSLPTHAAVTFHSFGPNNLTDIDITKCDLAANADTFFKSGENYMTLYVHATDGSCVRYKELESLCEPLLYYCPTKLYKYKSHGIAHFKKCPNPVFENKSFKLRSTKEEACKPINLKR